MVDFWSHVGKMLCVTHREDFLVMVFALYEHPRHYLMPWFGGKTQELSKLYGTKLALWGPSQIGP